MFRLGPAQTEFKARGSEKEHRVKRGRQNDDNRTAPRLPSPVPSPSSFQLRWKIADDEIKMYQEVAKASGPYN